MSTQPHLCVMLREEFSKMNMRSVNNCVDSSALPNEVWLITNLVITSFPWLHGLRVVTQLPTILLTILEAHAPFSSAAPGIDRTHWKLPPLARCLQLSANLQNPLVSQKHGLGQDSHKVRMSLSHQNRANYNGPSVGRRL